MKTNFLRADGRAFLILKYGLFTIISMFAIAFLYCRLMYELSEFDALTYRSYILPLAREMVLHTLSSAVLVLLGALTALIFEKTEI